MEYGYCRISMKKQSIERQIRNIIAKYPNAKIVDEAWTGTSMERPKWKKLLARIEPGDTIIFDSVSRMSRNAEDGVETYFTLFEKGIKLVFLKEPYINTDVYMENKKDRLELTGEDIDVVLQGINLYFKKLAENQIRIAFDQAEKEVQDVRQRTIEGLKTAKANGKSLGRRTGGKYPPKKQQIAKEKIKKYSKHFGGVMSNEECWEAIGISRNSFYKYLKEIRKEMEL